MVASVGNTSSGVANANSLAVAHTLGTGSDLVLVVSLGYSSGSDPTSVVWDPDGVNEALSLVTGAQGRSGAVTTQIWERVNPSAATGSGEVVVTFGGKTNQGFGVATLLGAGAGSDGTGNTAVQTLTVSNAGADDIIIDILRSDSNATIGANQTSFLDAAQNGKHYNASWQDGVDGGVMSWTGGGTTLRMAACRFPVAIADITVAVPLGTLDLTGFAPTVLENIRINVPAGSLNLTGFVPTVLEDTAIVVPPADTILDEYPFSNGSASVSLSSDNLDGVGQSFTGNGKNVASAVFELHRVGSPTGNAVCKIYAHSGTFGTSSIPTGAALATSENFDVSTLTAGPAEYKINFPTTFFTVDGTKYVVTFEYSGGDTPNRVQLGIDTSSPTHSGNYSDIVNPGSWTANSARDVVFEIHFKGSLNLKGYVPTPVETAEDVTIDVPTGSLTLTGFVPSVLENTIVNIPVASLTLTGFAPVAIETTTVVVPAASLTLTGFAPLVQEDTAVEVPIGSLVLTGFVPLPGENVVVSVPVASLTLTGFVPSFSEGVNVNVPSGSLTLTGFAVIPGENVVEIIPVASLTLTGFAPSAVENTIVNVPAGSLSLTGFIPAVLESTTISVPLGSLTLTGFVPTSFETTNISVPAGNLTLTGFVPSAVENTIVNIPVGSLTLTGLVPIAQTEVVIDVPVGSLALTGFVPSALENTILNIPVASLALTGFVPSVIEGTIINVPVGSLALTGFAPVPGENIVIDVPVASLTLAGLAPLVDFGVPVPVATLTLTGFIPSAIENFIISIPVASLTLTGFVPQILEDTVDVPTGSLTLTGFAPVTIFNIVVPIPLGTLNLTGLAPTLDTGVAIPLATLTLSGFAPTVEEGTNIVVPAATLSLSGFAPIASQNTSVDIPVGSLVLTGFAPVAIETQNDINVEVPLANLNFTSFAPASVVGGDSVVTPPTGDLILTSFEPVALSTIFNIESCDMDIIFPKNVDKLIIPALQEIEFNLERLKNIEFPDPLTIDVQAFEGFEPVVPTKEVERINFLYKDFSNLVQDILDGKIGELTNEVKPYDVEYSEWARSKEDLLEDTEEAIENSFDGEAARGFIAPSGSFSKDISKQAINSKKTLSRANEQFFSGQRDQTTKNISDGLQAGNVAENVVRTTDQQRQTINLQAVENLVDIDFRVFEVYLQRHSSAIEIKKIKHIAWVEELKGKLLQLQERELAIKGHTMNLIERRKQVELFNIAIDYLNAQQALKEIDLDNFILQSEIEKNKLLKFQAEVDQFSALINLNISKFNLYKAGINFEESKVDQYREEAGVSEAQLRVQSAKTASGRVTSNTKIAVAQAKLQAQLTKLRAARSRLDTATVEGQSKIVGFRSDLLVYQADLREWLNDNTHDALELIAQNESQRDLQVTKIRDTSRLDTKTLEHGTEAGNILDLAALNANVIAESANITAKTEITSKLVHTLAGG